MTDSKLREIIALAKGVGDNPRWKAGADSVIRDRDGVVVARATGTADTDHIAAADPATVRQMAEALLAARSRAGLLAANVRGMVGIERAALVEILSETNVRCLERSAAEVKDALALIDAIDKGGSDE